MSVIIQLHNLPLSASSVDIRNFFGDLNIPPGGVHIVGGKKGSAFIAFVNDEDARMAMERNGHRIKDARVKLALSSHRELKEVLEQLHQEQSEYEMSRKIRLSESKQERGRSHQRPTSRNNIHREFSPENHKSRGKYDDHSQKENLPVKQRSPYDRPPERKVQYTDSYDQEIPNTTGIDKPNPYVSSTYESCPEDERNEEIRKRIESFIAAFGQAENYINFDNKDKHSSQPFKSGRDSFDSGGFSSSAVKEAVQQNRSQNYPSSQIPVENYQPKIFDDFDSRRHFDERIADKSNKCEVLQGHGVSNMTTSYNSSREQEDRTIYNSDGHNFSSQGKTSNFSEDLLLNSPMDIEEDKNISNVQHNQHFVPHVFNTPDEMSKVHRESLPVPFGSIAFNVPPPFQSFANPGGDSRFSTSETDQIEAASCNSETTKDLCIKLVGLPYFANENDLRRVFRGASIFDMFIQYTSDGKATGTGFVQFSCAEDLHAAIKMKYCVIGDSRVEFYGSSRAELMEARMPSKSTVTNIEASASYEDVLALKRTQDILSSMMSSQSAVPTSYPTIPTSYPMIPASYPAIPTSDEQTGKRSLCAVITGFPSHFTRHIQVLRCIEEIGINFHLIHLVLNNWAKFTGKVFAEFHDLQDLDAALKKNNQSVEGCTIGVRQVLHEEMMKFLDSHRSRCMYPTPKQPEHLQKKPEKAPYIWEPPYETVEKHRNNDNYKRARDTPAVWSSERAIDDRRLVASKGFYSQVNKRGYREKSSSQAFNDGFSADSPHKRHPYSGGASHDNVERNRFQVQNTDMYNRVNPSDVNNSYSGTSKANEMFEVPPSDFFRRNSEMSLPDGGNRGFPSPRSKDDRGFASRKDDHSTSPYSRDKQHRFLPIHQRQKREDSPFRQGQKQEDSPFRQRQKQEDSSFHQRQKQEDSPFRQRQNQEASPFRQRQKQEDSPFHQRQKQEDSPFRQRQKQEDSPFRQRQKQEDPPFRQRQKRECSPTHQRLKTEDSPGDFKRKRLQGERNEGDTEVRFVDSGTSQTRQIHDQVQKHVVLSPNVRGERKDEELKKYYVGHGRKDEEFKRDSAGHEKKDEELKKYATKQTTAKANEGETEVRFVDSGTSQSRQIHNQEKKHGVSSQNVRGERKDEEMLKKYTGHGRKDEECMKDSTGHEKKDEELKKYAANQTTAKSKTDGNNPTQRNITNLKDGKEVSNASIKKQSGGNGSPQKGFATTLNTMEPSSKVKPERERVPGKELSSDNTTASKNLKKRIEHRKNCPKRQKEQNVEPEQAKPQDRPRHVEPEMSKFHDRSRHMEPEMSKPHDRSRHMEPELSRPRDRSRHVEPELSRSRDRSRHVEPELSRPRDRSRHVEPQWSRPGDRSRYVEPELSRPDDRSRHRSDRREPRKDGRDHLVPKDPFSQPGCVLEATNIDPHAALLELLDFFRGYGLQSENLIRRYTDAGDPTNDLRIAFHCPEDAEQAYKILNRQHFKGSKVMLSFI